MADLGLLSRTMRNLNVPEDARQWKLMSVYYSLVGSLADGRQIVPLTSATFYMLLEYPSPIRPNRR
jgi:hypothetical protein